MKKELLPIGTVVLLEGGTKKVMITGYSSKKADEEKVYDYNGCIFPEGFMENIYLLFDREQIIEVFYKGLENEEYKEYINNNQSSIDIKYSSDNAIENNSSRLSNTNRKGQRGMLREPTNPLSKSEMKAKYGVEKISGENIKHLSRE